MIVSASRRTDIPAFYSEWFINRVRAGCCCVVNPVNAKQVSRVSLEPADVESVVFWTKDPRPLMGSLDELDERRLRYYFLFTINGCPRALEPNTPERFISVEAFKRLSDRLGPNRVIWRFDPIVLTDITPHESHVDRFASIARDLEGYTEQVVISVFDEYRAARGRLGRLGLKLMRADVSDPRFANMIRDIAQCARASGMRIQSCAEELDLRAFGVPPGKCIDDDLIYRVFGVRAASRKDTGQRPGCCCVESRDIGVYDTCSHGCQYCYATRSDTLVEDNRLRHDPTSPSLVGWHDCTT